MERGDRNGSATAASVERAAWLGGVLLLAWSVPARAWALPNPFVLVFVADLFLQLLIVAALVVPLSAGAVQRRFRARVPAASARAAIVAGALGAASLAVTWIPATAPVIDPPLRRPDGPCAPLPPDVAREVGLPVGALVVDPRPAPAFAAYHLRGSCNRSLATLAGQASPIGAAPVFLADDRRLDPRRARALVPELAGLDLRALPDGLAGLYKPRDRAWGVGRAPRLVVDGDARPVSVEIGPFWLMGRHASVMGDDPTFRELPPSAVPQARAERRALLDVRTLAADDGGAPRLPPFLATLDAAERAVGGPLAGAVVLCDHPASCLAAESLAFELRARGEALAGYVRSHQPARELLSRPWWPADDSPALALMLLLLVALGTPLSVLALDAGAGITRRRGWTGVGDALAAGGAAAPLGVAALAWALTPRLTAAVGEAALHAVYMFDARRAGLGLGLAVVPLAFAAFVVGVERRLRRPSGAVRAGALLGLVALVATGGARSVRLLTMLDLGLLAVALLAARGLDVALDSRERRRAAGRGPRAVDLRFAAARPEAGGKIRGIAQAQRQGLRVPRGVALLTTRAELATADARGAAFASIVGALGRGPLVVRSSAPDEDAAVATPGRYTSVRDVRAEGLADAVGCVVRDYSVPERAPVAVVVQRQIDADLAGVAMREGPERGGGIAVEAARGDAVTAGRGATLRDHIGARSRSYVVGDGEGGPRARAVAAAIERLSPPLRRPEIEWATRGRALFVLQAREAPPSVGARTHEAAEALARLGPALRLTRGGSRAPVLDRGPLTDFPSPASRATLELLVELWSTAGPLGRATRAVRLLPSAPAADPAVLRLGGALYRNRLPARPLAALLVTPFARLERALAPLRVRGLCRALDQRLRRLEAKLPGPVADGLDPRALARAALDRRAALLGEPAEIACAVSLLVADRPGRRGADPDPLLASLACGEDPSVHGWRGLPDLALDRPRLGVGAPPTHLDAGPLPEPPDAALADLRGRVRQVLAAHAFHLRVVIVRLGERAERAAPFELGVRDLERLASGHDAKVPSPPEADPDAPTEITLAGLEAWAATGSPRPGTGARRGAWAGAPEHVRVGVEEAVVVDAPTVEDVQRLEEGRLLVAASGSPLCHAGLVARARGARALFGAGPAVLALPEGARIEIGRDGRWRIV